MPTVPQGCLTKLLLVQVTLTGQVLHTSSPAPEGLIFPARVDVRQPDIPRKPPMPYDQAAQTAWAKSVISDPAAALAWAIRLLLSIIGHVTGFMDMCSPTGVPKGRARTVWYESFLTPASGLHLLRPFLLWTGDRHSKTAVETALAVMKSCLGWFDNIEATVEAAAMWVLSNPALAYVSSKLRRCIDTTGGNAWQ